MEAFFSILSIQIRRYPGLIRDNILSPFTVSGTSVLSLPSSSIMAKHGEKIPSLMRGNMTAFSLLVIVYQVPSCVTLPGSRQDEITCSTLLLSPMLAKNLLTVFTVISLRRPVESPHIRTAASIIAAVHIEKTETSFKLIKKCFTLLKKDDIKTSARLVFIFIL
jgi:hypothetical protein